MPRVLSEHPCLQELATCSRANFCSDVNNAGLKSYTDLKLGMWFSFSALLFCLQSRVFPTFSSMRFSASGFILSFLMYLDFSFVHDKYGSIFIPLHGDIQLVQHHSRALSYFHCMVHCRLQSPSAPSVLFLKLRLGNPCWIQCLSVFFRLRPCLSSDS